VPCGLVCRAELHWRFAHAKPKNSRDAALQWYGESMEDTLLAYAPAILALGLALLLRLRRSRREASGQIAALQSKVAVLEQRTRELQGAQGQIKESANAVVFCQGDSAQTKIGQNPPSVVSLAHHPPAMDAASFEIQREIDEVLRGLCAMNARLPPGTSVGEQYFAEFDSLVDRLERATGCDLSRWLGISPQEGQCRPASPDEKPKVSHAGLQSCDSGLFRLRILSLQAFCNYHTYQSQVRQGFVSLPPEATGLIH
jgi:hypothetical protein